MSPRRPNTDPSDRAGVERLQKTLARAGYGSRRKAEELIEAGRVRVGPRVARLGDRVDPLVDRITVDGVPVPAHPELRYFVLNKPRGVTSTMHDPHAARSLAEYLPEGPRVFPVGRLDRDSEGLLLLTNDGELSNRLQHPRHGVEKEYLAEVEGQVPKGSIRRLTEGVELEDGIARAMQAKVVQRRAGRTALSIVMTEGRKREVRRMMDVLGHPVSRLVRVRIGPVQVAGLDPGDLRPLTQEEIAGLYRVSGLTGAAPGPARRSSKKGDFPAKGSSRGRELSPGEGRPDST
ncbi:MAG TPA: pseudouridine synthase [Actinomycetota bacterium]|nr:pseudouridine synthase [Actinomycetota bacterium]